ncbi:MAG: Zn-dependent exopeptidase M28 [Anaerolineales bacterium]|nr:Zn-dependent exopeptidase M28 [Anaerolineales bacterium]
MAVIIISQIPGIPPRHDIQHDNFFKPYPPVTSFRISWEQGHRLVQSEARKACLKLKTKRFPSQGRNIIAELKGSVYPDEIIVVCAHYDSPPDTPSATDNASGTAMLLELARLYAQRGSKRTLRFIAYDGEEAGFLGSAHYLKKLKQEEKTQKESKNFVTGRDKTELEKHLFCLNMDVLGMALGYNTCYVQGPPELTAAIKVMSKELGFAQQVNEGMYGSDNDPFALAGIPGVSFGKMGSDFLFIHTDGDTMDLMNKNQIQKTGGFIDQFLQRYAAGAQVWPFDRKVPEEQVKQLSDNMKKWMGDYFEVMFSGLIDKKG